MPSLYFNYHVGGLKLYYQPKKNRAFQFVLNLCAVLGGIYALANFLSNTLQTLFKDNGYELINWLKLNSNFWILKILYNVLIRWTRRSNFDGSIQKKRNQLIMIWRSQTMNSICCRSWPNHLFQIVKMRIFQRIFNSLQIKLNS